MSICYFQAVLTFDTQITTTHTTIETTSTLNRTTGTTMATTSIQEKVMTGSVIKLTLYIHNILVFVLCGVLGEVGDGLGDGDTT